MRWQCPHSRAQRVSAAIAALFGLVTLFAGGRVLFGLGEAGYVVVPAVLLFNTVMGVFYLVAAVLIVRSPELGRIAALIIAVANVIVLALVVGRRATGGIVANETMVAMAVRTVVWLGIFAIMSRALRPKALPSAA